MPNPAIIHTRSRAINHYLGLVDLCLNLNIPYQRFLVQPELNHPYHPDAVADIPGEGLALIELQLSHAGNRIMQKKIDGFVDSYRSGKHTVRRLIVYTNLSIKVDLPTGFDISIRPIPKKTTGVS